MTHIQGFGADYENMDQYKEELTVYLCREWADPSLIATTTTTRSRLDDEEEGWVVDGCCDPGVP
jgi:hypothetical protein